MIFIVLCDALYASKVCPCVLGYDSVIPTVKIETVKPASLLNLEDAIFKQVKNYIYLHIHT